MPFHVRKAISKIARRTPLIGRLIRERDGAIRNLIALTERIGWEPGHYYSPIPSQGDIKQCLESFARTTPSGIDLQLKQQAEWLNRVNHWYSNQPFPEKQSPGIRYFLDNPAFVYADGIVLYSMIRELNPRRIVEVGSGFSSAVMLDTNDLFFKGQIELTFIEPYPEERLIPLLKKSDTNKCSIIRKRIQDVHEAPWKELKRNDILFIDSSHVTKCGSDVNQLFFQIIPELAPGVVVHVHDIFPGFEYPEDWLKKGWFWNESYLLRAFLQFNHEFEILLWPSVLFQTHSADFQKMPLCAKNPGSSFWMRRRLQRET